MKPNFSVVLIAKDEAKTLPRLLKSLSEFLLRHGEVILLDTGSTDGTVHEAFIRGCRITEVGAKYVTTVGSEVSYKINKRFVVDDEEPVITANDKLFDYSAARNFAASLASNDMCFMPDCDEEVTKFDIDALNAAIGAGARRLEYNFVYAHDQFGAESVKFLHSKFYDRRAFKWVGIIHEVLQPLPAPTQTEIEEILDSDGVKIDERVISKVAVSEEDFHRTQFLDESVIKLEHWQNPSSDRGGYLKGLALDCYQNPENDRNSHYFAREMLYKGRLKSAMKEFERHIKMNKWHAERAQSMIYVGDILLQLGRVEEGLQSYHRAFLTDGERRESLIKLAEYCLSKDDYRRTVAYCEAALSIPYSGFYATNMDHYRQTPHWLLYRALWWLGDKKESKEHWKKALEYQPLNPKFLSDAIFYLSDPGFSISDFTKALKSGKNFTFVKLGDGEEICMRGESGQNCDGTEYSLKLGKKLKDSFTYLAGKARVAHWCDQDRVNVLLHRVDSDPLPVKEFWLTLRETRWPMKLFVGPKILRPVAKLLNCHFYEIPQANAFDNYSKILNDLVGLTWARSVVVVSGGMMAKCLIADLHRDVEATYIDAGSAFDSMFFPKETRTYQLPKRQMFELYKEVLPKVSVCIPSIRKGKMLADLLENVKENAGWPNFEIVVKYDFLGDNRQGCPKTLKQAVAESTGEFVMFLGEDCVPEKDFMLNAMLKMYESFENVDGFVGLNDGLWPEGGTATHWLASKSLLPLLGGEFFYTGYNHIGCDNELTARCIKMGKYAWAEEARVAHDHPALHGFSEESMDEVYKIAWNPEFVAKDRELLKQRAKEIGFQII